MGIGFWDGVLGWGLGTGLGNRFKDDGVREWGFGYGFREQILRWVCGWVVDDPWDGFWGEIWARFPQEVLYTQGTKPPCPARRLSPAQGKHGSLGCWQHGSSCCDK